MENEEKKVMPIKDKEYKEERFEFAVFANDNIVCKRNFKIYNFIEGSMNTLEFKECVDGIVKMIDEDLKSKSRVYTWYYYNEGAEDDEFSRPLIDPWVCTLKFVVYDNKQEVISKIWDGYAYPRSIRERIDLGNKTVKFTTKDGQVVSMDKETYFESNKDRLTNDMYVLKAMIYDKPDVLSLIAKRISETCSPSKSDMKDIDPSDNKYIAVQKMLDSYTLSEDYGNGKTYGFSISAANKKVENEWDKKTSKKTKEYFKNLF